jgi:hypothetical protein
MSMQKLKAQYLGLFAFYLKISPREIDNLGITDFVALTRFLDTYIESQKAANG